MFVSSDSTCDSSMLYSVIVDSINIEFTLKKHLVVLESGVVNEQTGMNIFSRVTELRSSNQYKD